MRWMILALCLWATAADAEPSTQVWAVQGSTYVDLYEVITGVPFTLAVTVRSDSEEISGADFKFHTPKLDHPLLFELSREYAGPQTLDLGSLEAGEHKIRFGGCAPRCDLRELMRVTYGDFSGEIDRYSDTLVPVSGLPDDGEHPVLYSCEGVAIAAPMDDPGGWWTTPAGVQVPPGATLLNVSWGCPCQPRTPPIIPCDAVVSIEDPTMSVLKSRFMD